MVIEYKTLRIFFEVPEPDAGSSGSGGGAGDDGDANDWLRLEQVEYTKPAAGDFNAWLDSIGSGQSLQTFPTLFAQYNSACDDEGCLEIEIQVHKSCADLNYTLTASYGTLSQQFVHANTQTKSITVRGEDSINLDYMPTGDVSAKWEGSVIGADGSIISPPPEITVDGSTLSWGQKVVGTLRVSFGESHDAYILTIDPRAADESNSDDAESAYQSTIVAVWDGGMDILEINLPSELDEGNCGGGNTSINSNDDDDDEKEKCYRLIEVRDPCTEELISSREEQIDCPTLDEREAAELAEYEASKNG